MDAPPPLSADHLARMLRADLQRRIDRELEAGAKLLEMDGRDPTALSLDGPLVPRPGIFGGPREGWRQRLNDARQPARSYRAPRAVSDLTGEEWLDAVLAIELPSLDDLLGRPWSAQGVAGPEGSMLDAVAQGLQVRQVALDTAALLGIGSRDDGPSSLLQWAAAPAEFLDSLDDDRLGRLGLRTLRGILNCAGMSLELLALLAGARGVTRDRSLIGRPPDIPFRSFALWLASAGARPRETAEIAAQLGILGDVTVEAAVRAIGRLKSKWTIGPTQPNPLRFLASLALQRQERVARPGPPPVASSLPPFAFHPPRTPAPAPEPRGDWVMVPMPSWVLGALYVGASEEASSAD